MVKNKLFYYSKILYTAISAIFLLNILISTSVKALPLTRADFTFLTMLKRAVQRNHPDIIANHILYPIRVQISAGPHTCFYYKKKDFIKNYKYLLREDLINYIINMKLNKKYLDKNKYGIGIDHYELTVMDATSASAQVVSDLPPNVKIPAKGYYLLLAPDIAVQNALLKHPSAAAGARLQALDAELAAICPPAPASSSSVTDQPAPSPAAAANAWLTPADIAFLKMLKQAVARNRPDIVARHIIYPLRVNFSDRSCYIQTPARFLRDYAAIFNADIRKVFADQSLDPKQIFANDEGFMIGDGDVWMATLSADSGKTFADYVTAINADSIASDRALHAPSAATGAHLQAILEPLRKICPAGQRR